MNLSITTAPEHDDAIDRLRKLHNRQNPNDPLTSRRYAERRMEQLLAGLPQEVAHFVDGEALRESFRAADDATKAQVRNLLNL